MFEKCGKVTSVTIARKKDPKKPDSLLSMGYGFVEFKRRGSADEAIKVLQVFFKFAVYLLFDLTGKTRIQKKFQPSSGCNSFIKNFPLLRK